MSDEDGTVVVVAGGGGTGGDDQGAAFAAGVATATATQAAADADEAADAAEGAQATAGVALDVAFDSRTAVDTLRDEMREGLAAVHARLDETTIIDVEEDVNPLTPEDVTEEPKPAKPPADDDGEPSAPKSKKKFGWDGWFGDR